MRSDNKISIAHQSEKDFWRAKKHECCNIQSVKSVYSIYKGWCLENNRVIQNEYRFRTFIRKNGYKPSSVPKQSSVEE